MFKFEKKCHVSDFTQDGDEVDIQPCHGWYGPTGAKPCTRETNIEVQQHCNFGRKRKLEVYWFYIWLKRSKK